MSRIERIAVTAACMTALAVAACDVLQTIGVLS